MVKYNNQLLCANRYGIFSYRPKKDKFIKDQKLSTLFTTEEYSSGTLIADETSRLWNFTVNNINYISPGQFSEQYKIYKIPISSELRQEMVGFETMVHLENDKYLIGRANGYMILDNKALNLNQYEVLLDRVAVKEKGKAFREIALNVKKLDIPFAQNTIRFEYSVPHYDKFINPKFQYRLEGFYDEWSDWTDQSYVEFENLPANSYNLMVRSKSGAEMNKNVIKYAFNIDKPWYLSTLSYILYVVLFCFIVALTHRSYKRYYAAQKTRLLAESQKQLERKQLESEKEIMRLKNERLIQDIENKNRELASSTLSVIQKNELLNSIKAELQKSRETGPNIQSVKKIIDKSINSKDDWKNFEEAFKNTDKDFLKKLKSLHANLTPNDLRFCTYLRLNLSSKEIAPLLNISVRSIEIKRYRLRKKLNLQHSESLVNYILSI